MKCDEVCRCSLNGQGEAASKKGMDGDGILLDLYIINFVTKKLLRKDLKKKKKNN